MENITPVSEMYFERIKSSPSPLPLLVAFFCTIFDSNGKDALYGTLGKLYKVYGREILFFSILDCYDIENFDTANPYGILSYFCKKRLEKKFDYSATKSLDKIAETVINYKQRKLKIPNLFEENKIE